MQNTKTKPTPRVLRGASRLVQGGGQDIERSRGDKNLADGPRPPREIMNIGTFNTRTLSKDTDIDYFIEQLNKVKLDIIGIQETKIMKELIAAWKDETQVFLGAAINKAKTGGVGFIVRPKYVKNISLCKIISERIAFLIIQINQKTTIKFISCYAPTTDYKDEDLEEFYKLLSKVLEHKSTYTIICGDMNAKLGVRKDQGRFVGPYGQGKRNERGDRLDEFAETEQLYVMNTFFKKRSGKRWTWSCKGPNSAIIKNEIDYIMCDCKRLVNKKRRNNRKKLL